MTEETEKGTVTVVATFKVRIEPDLFGNDDGLGEFEQEAAGEEALALIEDGVSFTSSDWARIADTDYRVTEIDGEKVT